MNGGDFASSSAATSGPPPSLEWRFSQVFGERTTGEKVQEGLLAIGAIARRMLNIRDRECFSLFCFIVFVFAVPCYSHETLFDGKTLYAGKELWKETLPLQYGSRVYKLQGLKSNSWYEVKISYPASIPALVTLQLLKNGVVGLKLNQMRRLLNTEKLIFKTESLEEVNNKIICFGDRGT